MSSLEDLERRVTVLEKVEAGLRAGVDDELSDIARRAQWRAIEALAITQSGHSRILHRMIDTLDQQTQKLDQIIVRLDRLAA